MRYYLALALTISSLYGEQITTAKKEDETEIMEEIPIQAPPPKPYKDLTAQNWAFAGGAVVAATIGIVLVALNWGHSDY